MNRKRRAVPALLIITLALLLPACAAQEKPSAASPLPASPSPSPSPSVVAPAPSPKVTYFVRPDYAHLTPYEPEKEVYTRLSEEFMPELVPSDDYGPLLPYVGSLVATEIWGEFYKYGLVTREGMIVTDAVYIGAYQRKDSSPIILTKSAEPPGENGELKPVMRYALCAPDGSWITPFIYEDVQYFDKVILLMRDSETNDIDVLDYDGNLLYNTKTKPDFAKLPPDTFGDPDNPEPVADFYTGDGFVAVIPWDSDSSKFYFNELIGAVTFLDFEELGPFSEGLAAVKKDGKWGYINTSFEIVLEPAYKYAGDFTDGRAVVGLPTRESAVIDRSGNILFKTKYGKLSYDNGRFAVCNDDLKLLTIYDENFQQVFHSKDAEDLKVINRGDVTAYVYVRGQEKHVLLGNATVTIPKEYHVYWVNDRFIAYGSQTLGKAVIATLDGRVIAERTDFNGDVSGYTANDGRVFFICENYGSRGNTTVLDETGKELFSEIGYVWFLPNHDLFAVNARDHFAYIDTDGNYIFRKSHLDSVPD